MATLFASPSCAPPSRTSLEAKSPASQRHTRAEPGSDSIVAPAQGGAARRRARLRLRAPGPPSARSAPAGALSLPHHVARPTPVAAAVEGFTYVPRKPPHRVRRPEVGIRIVGARGVPPKSRLRCRAARTRSALPRKRSAVRCSTATKHHHGDDAWLFQNVGRESRGMSVRLRHFPSRNRPRHFENSLRLASAGSDSAFRAAKRADQPIPGR